MIRTVAIALAMSLGEQRTWVGNRAGNRRCGRSEWTREQCPAAGTLAPLEVAIARRDGKLPGSQRVAIHRDAHRAACLAPLGAPVDEDAAQALRLGRGFHGSWAGPDEPA